MVAALRLLFSQLDLIVMGYYEAVLIYAQEVTRMVQEELDFSNGSLFAQRVLGSTYDGVLQSELVPTVRESETLF